MIDPVLIAIQVGKPRHLGQEGAEDPMDRPWTTGVYKEPVVGPVMVRKINIDGDEQADRVHHGGPDKAVMVYSANHYPAWQRELGDLPLSYGAFGENFTIQDLTESDVCIGDIWQVGHDVQVQVSQPRQPCWKLARRWRIKTLALQLQQTGRTGWYFRVLQEGMIAPGMSMTLCDRPFPHWPVSQANHVMHVDKNNLSAALELAAVPLLAENWRATLTRRAQHQHSDPNKRLIGENE
ncbi:MAG: MOSC domain-containing protein [Bacteroidales bacterium]|nr:MOSC domain-containing protein [Bacteroidales bacterium]